VHEHQGLPSMSGVNVPIPVDSDDELSVAPATIIPCRLNFDDNADTARAPPINAPLKIKPAGIESAPQKGMHCGLSIEEIPSPTRNRARRQQIRPPPGLEDLLPIPPGLEEIFHSPREALPEPAMPQSSGESFKVYTDKIDDSPPVACTPSAPRKPGRTRPAQGDFASIAQSHAIRRMLQFSATPKKDELSIKRSF